MSGLAEKWSDALAGAGRAPAPVWLRDLREKAVGQFVADGLPHRKVEAWKYTPLKLLEDLEVQPAAETAVRQPQPEMPPALCGRAALVDFVGGQLQGALPDLGPGVTLLPLPEGVLRFEGLLRPLFEELELAGSTRAFAALNTACAEQGLVVHVAPGVDAGTLALRWTAAGEVAAMHHCRLFLLLENGARLGLIEQHHGVARSHSGLNVLSQAELGIGAALQHTRVQTEADQAVLLTSTRVRQAGASRYEYNGFDLGAGLARHEITVLLSGPGATADVAGAFVLDGRRHTDNHICVEHRAPACRSEQFFRGVLGGHSRGVFNGRALIQAGADGSSVRQSNANLLLSPLAEMDTKPELEIYADEVEASHGATVGQLDETAVFYLRSRGLSELQARRMLTTAFCHAVSDRLADRELAARIGALLDAAMPGSGSA